MSLRDDQGYDQAQSPPCHRRPSRRRRNSEQEQAFGAFVMYLKQSRGFDFAAYQRPRLQQRLNKRLQALRIKRIRDYQDYVEAHPDEYARLLHEILIQSTAFFRDKAAWTYLAETTIPRLLASRDDQSHIRVWSAGCASGEEAYTLAMVLAEALGLQAFCHRVRIFATDVDEGVLTRARQGLYSASALQRLPDALRDAYFEPAGKHFAVVSELRRRIVFGRHHLALDAPMPHLDLLVCRNTLIYFSAEAQSRILSRFYYALKDTGALFLGKAETPVAQTPLFAPLCLKHRVFAKAQTATRKTSLRDIDTKAHYEIQEVDAKQSQLHIIIEELQDKHEQLEAMNEEIQSSNEELETVNEELQATNEELKTLNDELQDNNIILQNFRDDLHRRDEELAQLFAFTQSILTSLQAAVIVIDPTFGIVFWNPQASKLWGVDAHQAEGQSLLHLDIGLPTATLNRPIRSILAGQTAQEALILDATHRLGQPIQCHITCTPLLGAGGGIQGAILLMEVKESHG